MRMAARSLLAGLALTIVSAAAQAAIFDDDEARARVESL